MEPWWNPARTLVEPFAALVEPLWSLPQTTPDHPAALAEPGGTLMEPYFRAAPDHPGAYLG